MNIPRQCPHHAAFTEIVLRTGGVRGSHFANAVDEGASAFVFRLLHAIRGVPRSNLGAVERQAAAVAPDLVEGI